MRFCERSRSAGFASSRFPWIRWAPHRSISTSAQWYEFDLGWAYIRVLAAMRLATVRKVAPQVRFERAKAVPDLATRLIAFDEPYLLEPGRTVHGITRERIFLPPDICGWLEGRSRIARLGLTVHVTSGFIQPAVSNHQVLEMSNVSGRTLRIHPGIRICQIVLQRCEGEAIYRGQFASQNAP